mmetsp:Transcript_3614/g.7922  ORF Transcript_3614/g.7922 Transcript_3614/m.7922 type:complete len:565 (+) Transcript_3614:173-1867(+)|eukprot:CAMPEP_0178412674 /NCGR_PEP_ID=MMETSP0689_2-20121128/22137_1 /TAXON_ID=160604 /ORGANISM="Amphidinium massartii, Strain CS-259" /LENGTH=564 /DNA_ID=CAMNT_0020033929 /DNA_START=79 /DNA_END=1770 /DNA_ORIENTATION=+
MGCGASGVNATSRYACNPGGDEQGVVAQKSNKSHASSEASSPTSPRSPLRPQVSKKKSPEEEQEDAKMQIIRDVYIFRHLAEIQLEHLVRQFELLTYKKGENIVTQSKIGCRFFVISTGEVAVKIDDTVVRHLGKNAYFGERALLFDEPRTASVEVVSATAECWGVSKATFLAMLNEKMHQLLMYRIRLQDTSISMDDLRTLKCIGAGAMGSVELVIHKKTFTHYALKKVSKEDGVTPERCLTEVHLLAMNDHPFVLHLVKTFETPAEMCILTELVTGGELFAAIRTFPTNLSRRDAQFYVGSLTLALEALHHRRILYRDLKPENILLDAQGYVKMIDFGVAMKMDKKHRTFTVIGTPHYMAPEMIRGRGYGLLVDIWAMGVILYEMVCGYLPFGNEFEIPQDVFKAVINGSLTFPDVYKDADGMDLIQALLRPSIKDRLGVGGYTEIKEVPWFQKAGGFGCSSQLLSSSQFLGEDHKGPSLFDGLLARELEPPLIPDISELLEDEEESTAMGMALVEPRESRECHNRVSLAQGSMSLSLGYRGRSKAKESHTSLEPMLEDVSP